MTTWLFKTDKFGQIDYTWVPLPFPTEEIAYQELVDHRESAKHDEFFRLMDEVNI